MNRAMSRGKRVIIRLVNKHLGGHFRIGRLTVYGFNAMHVAINFRCLGMYWCFHPTIRWFGQQWPWYFYVSPNATPWAALFTMGPGVSMRDRERAHRRMQLVRSTRLLDPDRIGEVARACEDLGNAMLEASA